MIKLNSKNNSNKSIEESLNDSGTQKNSDHADNLLLKFINMIKNQSMNNQDLDALSNTLKNLEFRSVSDFNNLKELTFLLTNLLKAQSFNSFDKMNTNNLKDKEISFKLPSLFKSLEPLFEEIIDDNPIIAQSVIQPIETYFFSIENMLIDEKVNEVYEASSILMNQLSEFDFSQRKYVYKAIVEIFNNTFNNYKFISPEDINHIDTDIHKVVQGDSLRIKCGLSLVLLNKNSNAVIEYGKVKTF